MLQSLKARAMDVNIDIGTLTTRAREKGMEGEGERDEKMKEMI